MKLAGISGRVAFVTGAAGGIGSAIVRALSAEGARVVAVDVDASGLARLRVTPGGDSVRVDTVDVCNSGEVERAIAEAEDEWGPIELGVNVAGVLSLTSVVDTDPDSWRRVFAVNADGVFNVSRALARRMVSRRRGSMVTVSSNAAGVPRKGMAAYAASKAAATMFTRCLGLELAEHGIRCNIVAPGSTRTAMQEGMWADGGGGGLQEVLNGSLEAYRTGIPLRKLAEPDDVASAVLFLLSDNASHITMAELYVDGGATLRA